MEKFIRMQGLTVATSIGIHDFEKAALQPYKVDMALRLVNAYRLTKDAIDDAVNYDILRDRVVAALKDHQWNTQEMVIERILAICFELDPRVIAAEVKVAKTAVYPDVESVGLHYSMTVEEWHQSKG